MFGVQLNSLCLGEGDIFLNICNILTATRMAAKLMLNIMTTHTLLLYILKIQRAYSSNLSKNPPNKIQPLLTARKEKKSVACLAMSDVSFLQEIMQCFTVLDCIFILKAVKQMFGHD